MPVVTRSRSKRGKKKQEEPTSSEGSEQSQERKTPRRSARIAAQKRSQSRELSDEGRQTSMTPVSDPTKKPYFSGITLGHETLGAPMQLIVPRHEPESQHSIRQSIRQFTESPVTLKQTKNQRKSKHKKRNKKSNNKNSNNNSNNSNNSETDTDYTDTDYTDTDNDNDASNITDEHIKQNLQSSLLSPNRNMQLTHQPSRVPTFNHNSQSWSFEPETEMPTVARNLIIFMIGLIIVVLAVIYKDELFAACDTYMPVSVSDAFTKVNDFALAIYTYFYDLITSLFAFNNDNSGGVDSDTATDSDATDTTVDAASETVTE